MDENSEKDHTINMAWVSQVLFGCPDIPWDIQDALVIFDHTCDQLSVVNTCAPSLTFRRCPVIRKYEKFEELMLEILVGAGDCFGRDWDLYKLDFIQVFWMLWMSQEGISWFS